MFSAAFFFEIADSIVLRQLTKQNRVQATVRPRNEGTTMMFSHGCNASLSQKTRQEQSRCAWRAGQPGDRERGQKSGAGGGIDGPET